MPSNYDGPAGSPAKEKSTPTSVEFFQPSEPGSAAESSPWFEKPSIAAGASAELKKLTNETPDLGVPDKTTPAVAEAGSSTVRSINRPLIVPQSVDRERSPQRPATSNVDQAEELAPFDPASRLDEYEELFKNRYTSDDAEYAKSAALETMEPVIIEPWPPFGGNRVDQRNLYGGGRGQQPRGVQPRWQNSHNHHSRDRNEGYGNSRRDNSYSHHRQQQQGGSGYGSHYSNGGGGGGSYGSHYSHNSSYGGGGGGGY